MPNVDLFRIWRLMLVLVGSVYTVVRMIHGLHNWNKRLAGRDRRTRLARKYVIVKLLGIRWRRFGRELVWIVLLAAALIALLWVHHGLGLFSVRAMSYGKP